MVALRRRRGIVRVDYREDVRAPAHAVRLTAHTRRHGDADGRRPGESRRQSGRGRGRGRRLDG
eukprot:5854412-Prymnesium_polylepis.1